MSQGRTRRSVAAGTPQADCNIPGTTSSAECLVYRVFDDEDRLLYVGVTGNLTRRLWQHASVQPWWFRVERVASEQYPTRQAALEAEAAAIRAERPQMNVAHTDKVVLTGSNVRLQLLDFFEDYPGSRQRDAVIALGIERAVVSANTGVLVAAGILVLTENRSYVVDYDRFDEIAALLEGAAGPLQVFTPPNVESAVNLVSSELRVHLVRFFAENPDSRQVDAMRILGVERAVISVNTRALLATGVLIKNEAKKTYRVDSGRFRELIQALEDFGPTG